MYVNAWKSAKNPFKFQKVAEIQFASTKLLEIFT